MQHIDIIDSCSLLNHSTILNAAWKRVKPYAWTEFLVSEGQIIRIDYNLSSQHGWGKQKYTGCFRMYGNLSQFNHNSRRSQLNNKMFCYLKFIIQMLNLGLPNQSVCFFQSVDNTLNAYKKWKKKEPWAHYSSS